MILTFGILLIFIDFACWNTCDSYSRFHKRIYDNSSCCNFYIVGNFYITYYFSTRTDHNIIADDRTFICLTIVTYNYSSMYMAIFSYDGIAINYIVVMINHKTDSNVFRADFQT